MISKKDLFSEKTNRKYRKQVLSKADVLLQEKRAQSRSQTFNYRLGLISLCTAFIAWLTWRTTDKAPSTVEETKDELLFADIDLELLENLDILEDLELLEKVDDDMNWSEPS